MISLSLKSNAYRYDEGNFIICSMFSRVAREAEKFTIMTFGCHDIWSVNLTGTHKRSAVSLGHPTAKVFPRLFTVF
jgi:hypothetical protein